ncbi:MAG: hypothetical protein JST23_00480 [Bacteroidetes bacterium]|nr:hypothetical protein [Bacteroidota bacterium]
MKKTDTKTVTGHSNNEPQSKTRRKLLKLLGLSTGLGATKAFAGNKEDLADSLFNTANLLNDKTELVIYRPQDMLELKMTFTGYKKSSDNKSLIKTSAPYLLFVEFQPQSIAEQAWEEGGGQDGQANFDIAAKKDLFWNKTSDSKFDLSKFIPFIQTGNTNTFSPPAKTYLSGKTRLVFDTRGKDNIALSPSGLLNWDGFQLVVNKRATCAPVFSASDINLPPFKRGSFDIPNNLPPIQVPGKNDEPVKKEPIKIEPVKTNPNIKADQNIRIRTLPTNQDTIRRQVEINREIRRAGKDETLQIQKNELPAAAIKANDGIIANIGAFLNSNKPAPIGDDETSIEMPYRLFISPNQYAAWKQDKQLKKRLTTYQGVQVSTYELWHSRLASTNCGGRVDNSKATKVIRTIRALWATDIDGDWKNKPERDFTPNGTMNASGQPKFITSLYNDDRHCIVHQTSNFGINGFTPKSVQVNNLMLSSLGAWLDAIVQFKRNELDKVSSDLNMLKWKHIATLARDHYVEVVYAGNMYPLGHEAALVRITERKPKDGYAANWQRYFVAITEEEKKYNPVSKDNKFNAFPFSSVKIITAATPTIKTPSKFVSSISGNDDAQFIPTMLNGKPFVFKMVGYDYDGGDVSFEMPLVFVSTNVSVNNSQAYDEGNINKLNSAYNNNAMNTVSFRNQVLALARSVDKPGETHYETNSIIFNGRFDKNEPPGFVPTTASLDVFINAVENITGQRSPVKIKLEDDRNAGTVFASLLPSSGKLNVDFNGSGNKTGGSLSPNFSLTGLSKTYGAISGKIDDVKNKLMDPKQFFNTDAKLFGIIPLSDIIEKTTALLNGESPIPALKNIETDEAKITQYKWKGGKLRKESFFGGIVTFSPSNNSRLVVDTSLYRYKTNKPNALVVDSSISDFDIILLGLAKAGFKKVGFKTGDNAKLDFTVDMKDPALEFLGPLTFINTLQKYIPTDGFSDPPFLDITTSGVTSGYTLALPDVQLGAFTLRNINLGASVSLSFTGGPLIMRFNFCEKHQPFILTVSALGGGGFFAMEFDMKGLRSLEAAMEFGAAASINLGVASGAVSIMGGVYFKIQKKGDGKEITIEGYIRINGALSVLGLITVSVEFLLTIAAVIETVKGKDKVTKLYGKAQLKVKVEVFMFSKTVSLETSREFAGAGADPTFAMLISEDEWKQYCDTFAA